MKEAKKILLIVLVSIILALVIDLCIGYLRVAMAEDADGQAWVLCHPESHVCLRANPRKSSPDFGSAVCGTHLMTDSSEKNGYLHVVDLASERESGWISLRYVVFDEPSEVNAVFRIRSDGRVACRRYIGGKIIRWLNDGDSVTVYWMSDSWAVTDNGYIRSEFLEEQ